MFYDKYVQRFGGITEKPPKGKSKSELNQCGLFVFSIDVFIVLKNLKPSIRGDIELTEAINHGIMKQNWKVRVIKMAKNQFRGDFGDIKVYEQLVKDSSWLKELSRNQKKKRLK